MARQLRRPLVFIECGPDDKPSPHAELENLRQLCPSIRFLRLGGAEPVSEEVKRQALAAADVAISLVDNAQETFGLAVAEAMASGLPLVLSDWSGYRDLVRDGIDGYLIPSAWLHHSPSLSCFGMAAFGTQGSLLSRCIRLVKLDLAAAEMALLTVLSQSAMARAMGAWQPRARDLFSPDLVMAAHEELFRVGRVPCRHRPMPIAKTSHPQLDPVGCLLTLPPILLPPLNHCYHCMAPEVCMQYGLFFGILGGIPAIPNVAS